MITLRAGAQAPEYLRIRIANPALDAEIDDPPLDLTTVSAVVWKVRKGDGSRTTWSLSIDSQTADLLVIRHVFALGDLVASGTPYRFDFDLTVPGGVRRAGPSAILVVD